MPSVTAATVSNFVLEICTVKGRGETSCVVQIILMNSRYSPGQRCTERKILCRFYKAFYRPPEDYLIYNCFNESSWARRDFKYVLGPVGLFGQTSNNTWTNITVAQKFIHGAPSYLTNRIYGQSLKFYIKTDNEQNVLRGHAK